MTGDIDQLKQQYERLQELASLLSATVLRNAAVQIIQENYTGTNNINHLMTLAEQCFTCAGLPGLKPSIAAGLQAAGHELMARAVDADTNRQRSEGEEWPNVRRGG
jgi:hypothetical protein